MAPTDYLCSTIAGDPNKLRICTLKSLQNSAFQRNKEWLEGVFVAVRGIAVIRGIHNVSEIRLQIF